jgi:hypothetical protein
MSAEIPPYIPPIHAGASNYFHLNNLPEKQNFHKNTKFSFRMYIRSTGKQVGERFSLCPVFVFCGVFCEHQTK